MEIEWKGEDEMENQKIGEVLVWQKRCLFRLRVNGNEEEQKFGTNPDSQN